VYPERTGTLYAGGLNGGKPNQWFGDHGGASWGSHAVPLIISGAGVRSGNASHFPARLVDLAPTFLRLLGVPFPALDGVVLADALAAPIRSETSAQRVMAEQLIPITSAMKRQSKLDLARMASPGINAPVGAPQVNLSGHTY
jgi:arylsulfatase A-like enzyme